MKKSFTYYTIMAGWYSTLIFSVIVASSSFLSAKNGYGQKLDPQKVFLSLQAENKPLEKVFKDIEHQTDFRFFYDAGRFNIRQLITLNSGKESVYKVLLHLSDETGLEFMQIDNYFSVRRRKTAGPPVLPAPVTDGSLKLPQPVKAIPFQPATLAADTLVQGTVADESGAPLVGVTVQLKGTSRGVVSDANGNFSMEIPAHATLVFSYIGYEKEEIAVAGAQNVRVRLSPSASGLNEVVVVGYGTQKKRDVTSAVSQVSGEEIRQTPAAALQNGLSGKLPGLFSQQRSGRPGGENAASVYIRGVSTFAGSQEPLVLVDDVEYDFSQLFLIDPNEVESISILKDAASTAIYGIKGANGVILVTTRRGATGKPVIHLSTNWGIQTPVHVLQTLGAYQSALLQNEALENDGLAPMFTDEDLELFKTGADPYGHPDVDWYDVLFKRRTLITNNNLDISGGSKRVRYFITLGYMFQNGLLKHIPYKGKDQAASGQTQANTNFFAKRYKFRSNLDIKATNSLDFQLDIAGTRQAAQSPKFETGFSTLFRYEYTAPYIMPVYNPDGSFGYGNPNRMVPPNGSNNMAAVYALGGYTKELNDFMNVHLSGTQKLDDITKGLSLKGSVAYSFANTAARTLTRYQAGIPTYWYNPEDGTYHPRDPNVYTIPPYQLVYDASTKPAEMPVRHLNLQGSLAYQRTFGSHNVGGLLLYNQLSNLKGPNPPANFKGYTFRFTYNYKHKYLLEMSGAYNGSDRFVTQKQYQLFPALSAGWNLANEPFFNKLFPFADAFKIRGSYGWVGSDDVGGNQYLYEQVYDRTGSYSFGQFDNNIETIVEGTQGNLNVTWQTERKADVGIDFSFLKGKFSGSIDYFNNYRYHILTHRSTVPPYIGVQQSNLPPVNIGKVNNQGYEIEFVYKGNISKIGLLVKGNFSFARNKILFKDEPPPKYPWEKQTGRSIGMIRQYTWLGFYQDQKDIDTSATPAGEVRPGYLKYKDLNGDGIINQDDMAYMGYPNLPNTNIGLTLGLRYRGLSLTVLLQSAINFDVYMGNENAVPFKAKLQPIHMNRWTPETAATATFPALTTTFNGSYMNPDSRSTFWTTRGDYLRIRSMDLAYTFPAKLVNKVGLAGVQAYINGYDLFTWSKFLKRFQFDPEVKSGAGGYIYPPEKILNFGLNVTFK